ncbi:MAG TPA: hypothetical protein IAC31_02205 [Candidatus Faecousia intestinigallinarum]|nr:hypothetical protein [Candidatus Faecousia intestinigallinarum]
MGKILRSNEDIRLAVLRRGKQIAATMSDQEFFLSSAFQHYANTLARFLLGNHSLSDIHILYQPDSKTTAFTDGRKITWNTGTALARNPKLLERRFQVNMGILFHEISHMLFTDFDLFSNYIEQIQAGSLPGHFPKEPEYAAAYEELQKAMSDGHGKAIASVYASLSNCLDDGHDEFSMKQRFPGLIADSITAVGEEHFRLVPSIRKMMQENWPDASILSTLILEYLLFGEYQIGQETPEVLAWLENMRRLEPLLEAALYADDYAARWDILNAVMLCYWPAIRQMFQQPQAGAQLKQPTQPQSASPSGNGASSPANGNSPTLSLPSGSVNTQPGGTPETPATANPSEIANSLQEQLQRAQRAAGINPAPKNCTGKGSDPSAVNTGNFSSLLTQISNDIAASQVQHELNQATMDAIRSQNCPLIHSDIQEIVVQKFSTSDSEKQLYRKIFEEVASIERNLTREMLALLRDMNDEDMDRHRAYGPIIEATDMYRPDRRYFSKKRLPADLPDMAVAVLVDQSGSMAGSKLMYARKAAILLERFTSHIGIPCLIAGHHTNGASSTKLYIYKDFIGTAPDEDRFALAGMITAGANRDGIPIRSCAKLLSQRPEQVKLLVVISDGAPYHKGYAGQAAVEDIQAALKEYRKKGLQIYGAAIDSDQEVIENIYGTGFLSIQNLNTLPKTLVRLVRRSIT